MPFDPDQDSIEFWRGKLLALESEQKAIRRIHGELADELERLGRNVRDLRQDISNLEERANPWRENTEVRNQRRAELESLRVQAENAEVLANAERGKRRQQLAIVAPAIGALLYALAELVRSFVHH